jgi:hypothetical protein
VSEAAWDDLPDDKKQMHISVVLGKSNLPVKNKNMMLRAPAVYATQHDDNRELTEVLGGSYVPVDNMEGNDEIETLRAAAESATQHDDNRELT